MCIRDSIFNFVDKDTLLFVIEVKIDKSTKFSIFEDLSISNFDFFEMCIRDRT